MTKNQAASENEAVAAQLSMVETQIKINLKTFAEIKASLDYCGDLKSNVDDDL